MSSFVHHEPCPRCGSRNNLGVWDDEHKYCFGCGYYVPSPENIEQLKKKTLLMEHNKKNDDFGLDTSGFTGRIPVVALGWLKKYGITEFEVMHYGIVWNENTSSLVFPIYNPEKRLIYCQERYFGPDKDKPKYITHGSKSQQLAYINSGKFPKTVVLVEDYISAIKVARCCSASPLLGSSLDLNAAKWVVARFNRVRIWLDLDKASHAIQEASKLSQAIKNTRVILTQLDPKEYSTPEIAKHLAEAGIK